MFVGTWFGYWTVEKVCDCNIDLWQEQLENKMGTWVMMHGFQQFNHETFRFQSRTSPTKFFWGIWTFRLLKHLLATQVPIKKVGI